MTYLSAAGIFLAQQLKMLTKIPSTKKLLENQGTDSIFKLFYILRTNSFPGGKAGSNG